MYFVASGRSHRRDQISRRRALKEESDGGVDVGLSDIANSRYKRRQSCTEIRSRKSLRKLFSRGTSKRKVDGNWIDDDGDNKFMKAGVRIT